MVSKEICHIVLQGFISFLRGKRRSVIDENFSDLHQKEIKQFLDCE